MISNRPRSYSVFVAVTLAAFGGVALAPVAAALLIIFGGDSGCALGSAGSVMSEARQWPLLGHTLAISLGAALGSGVAGTVLAFAIEFARVPFRRFWTYALGVPLLIPSYIGATAWIDLLGRRVPVVSPDAPGLAPPVFNVFSLLGVVLVFVLAWHPIVMYTVMAALRRLDVRVEDAARLVWSPARVVIHVTLPLVLPAVLAGGLLVFILALTSFAVPSLMQVQVYPVEIYSRFAAFHNFGEAVALALPLVVVGVLALAAGGSYTRSRRRWFSAGERFRTTSATGPAARAILLVICALVFLIAAVAPLVALGRRAGSWSSFALAADTAKEEIATSLALASLSALAICGLSLAMVFVGRRGPGRVFCLSLISFLVSGPVLGIGLIALWNHAGARALVYDTFAIVVLALIGRYLVFGHQGLAWARDGLGPRLLEAAETAGVSWHRQLILIVAPRLAPALAVAFGTSFILGLGELDAVVLVAPPGVVTLSVRLFTLMHYGPSSATAALALLTVAVIFAAAALTGLLYHLARRLVHAGG